MATTVSDTRVRQQASEGASAELQTGPGPGPGPRVARVALALLLAALYSTLSVVRSVTNALRDAGLLNLTVIASFVLVGLLVAVAVWRMREARTTRMLVAGLAAAAVYALPLALMSSPEEKLHFVEYGAVGVLAFLSTPPRWRTSRRTLFAALFTAAAGWVDEGIQGLIPARYYDLRDVGFNAVAGLLALATFLVLRHLATPERPSGEPS